RSEAFGLQGSTDSKDGKEIPMIKSNGRAKPRRRSLLLAGAGTLATPVLASGLAGYATSREPGPVVQFGQARVRTGDRWVYREINRYNGLTLADVEVTVTAESPLTCNVRRTRSDTTAGEIARTDAVLVERYAHPWAVDL